MPLRSSGDEPTTATTGRDEPAGGTGWSQRPTMVLGAPGVAATCRWRDAGLAERPSHGDNPPATTTGGGLRGGHGRPIATVTPRTGAHACPPKMRNGRAVIVVDRELSSSIFHRDGDGVGRRGLGIAVRRRPQPPHRRREPVRGWPSILAKGSQRRGGRRAGRGAARSSFRRK